MMHFRVRGRVQGVWFRGFVQKKAQELGLSGWVRNRNDGSVEVLAEGPASQLSLLREACVKGPLLARVDFLEPVSCPDAPLPLVKPGVFAIAPTA